MAKVYLDAADTTFTLSNAAAVFGAAGDQKVIVNEGVTGVVFDQLVERVDLPGNFADFTYKQAGNGLQVYDGTTLIATIPLQADGTQIVTSAGSVTASLTAGVMTLGGSTVSDVAAGAVAPTAVDTTVTTGSTFVPVPTFSVTGPTTAVEGASAVYTVNLSTAQATATTVEVALSGTATPSTTTVLGDFGSLTSNMTIAGATLGADGKTLTFAPGVTSASITVPVNFDTTTETGETLIATLANPSTGAVLGTGVGSATTTLQDAPQPAFALTSNAVAGTPTQEGSTIAFTVTPASVVAADTTMSINLTGAAVGGVSSTALPADFSPNSTTVTFKAGDTAAKTVNVTVIADGASEGLEGYKASLLDGTGFTEISSTTGTINDPVPALTLTADKTAVDEGSSVTYTVTSTLAAPTGGIVVPYTLGGNATLTTDYTGSAATTGTITIAAGAKTGTLILSAKADSTTEATAEDITVTLGAVTGATITAGTATTTITDTSKALGTAEIALSATASSVDEGGAVTYTVTRGSAVTGSAVVVPYTLAGTATSGTDYTRSESTGNLTIAVGSTTASVTVTTLADNATEGTTPETVIMTLGTLPTGTTTATGQGGPITTAINDTSVAVVGQTFTLTTAVNAIPGLTGSLGTVSTDGNDTIVGEFSATAGANTLNPGDQINGGAGIDILKMYGTYAVAQVPVTIINTETLDVVVAADAALDFSAYTKAASGVTTVMVENATAMSGKTITTTAGQSLSLATGPTGSVTAGAVTWAGSATDTALNLGLNGYQWVAGGTPAALTVTGAAATTLNIASTGAANKTGTFTGPTTVTSHVISGDKALTYALAAADAAALNSINASASTGGVSADVSAGTAKAAFTFTGGSGNDKVIFADNQFGTFTTGAQIIGNAGTDTLGVKDTAFTVTEYARINQVSGFDMLSLEATGATIDVAQVTSVSKFAVGAGAFTEIFNNAKSTTTFTVDNTSGNTSTTINNAVGETATNVTLDNQSGASKTLGTLAFSGISTATIQSTGLAGGANVLTNITNADNSAITVTGNLDFSLGGLDATTTGSKVDASTFTGKLTVTGTTKSDVLIGGSAADTIQGATTDTATQADTLTGNAGADTFKFVGSHIANLMDSSNGTTAVARITDFTAGSDKILLDDTGATATSIALATAQTIATAADLTAVYAGITAISASVAAGAYAGVVVNVTAGAAAGTYLYINDATPAVDSAADMLINITGISGTLTAADFLLA